MGPVVDRDIPGFQQPEPRYAPLSTDVTGERGDAGYQGFWERRRNTIFDIRITDTEAPTYRNQDYDKILAAQEKEKKKKKPTLPPCPTERLHPDDLLH